MTSNEKAFTQHLETLIDGIAAKDLDLVKAVYSPDMVSFDIEPPLQHLGVEAKLANWAKVFTIFRDVRYELRDLTVTAGEDVAFAHGFGRLSGTLADGTRTDGMWVRITLCGRKLNGHWTVTHDQVSIPFDITVGQAATTLNPETP